MGAPRSDGQPPVVRFDITGPIVPKGRPRVAAAIWKESGAELVQTRKAHAYTPKSTKAFEERVAWEARAAMRKCLGSAKLLEGDIVVTIAFAMGEQKGDIDNYAKAILDGMNKVVYEDDAQVKELHCYIHKSDGESLARVVVSLCQADQ